MTFEATIMDFDPKADTPEPALPRARGGDLTTFESLMRRHERLVFGTARRLLGATEDAEDVAQEVFLRLYRHLERLDPTRPLGSWLYRVTVNACLSLGRRRRVRATVEIDRLAGELVSVGPDPAAAAELGEEHQMVAEGLESLTGKEREALVLHDLEGLSTQEVAAALDITDVTVRTHLCRARQKMRAFRERWHGRTP